MVVVAAMAYYAASSVEPDTSAEDAKVEESRSIRDAEIARKKKYRNMSAREIRQAKQDELLELHLEKARQ